MHLLANIKTYNLIYIKTDFDDPIYKNLGEMRKL